MKVLGINHIGLAAKDPVKARWFLEEVLGLPFEGEELVAEQKTNTLMFLARQSMEAPLVSTADSRLEILVNQKGQDGPIQRFIDSRGGGLHHLAITVDSIELALSRMQELKVKMIDEVPRQGAHNTRIAFVHPHATGGLLIELVEEAKK